MRIFVFGATGVVGRRVVPALVDLGHQVSAHGRSVEKRSALEASGAAAVALDPFSAEEVRTAVSGHDSVINLATSIPSSTRLFFPGAWKDNNQIRRVLSKNIVDAALSENVGRIVQESFGLIYKDIGQEWIDESGRLDPAPHTQAVLDAESAVGRFTENGGAGVLLRFSLFYGPDSPQTMDMINSVRRGFALMPGPDDAYISSVSHDDAAAAVLSALDLPAGIYNVSDDLPLTRREYFDSMAAALDVNPPRLLPAWTKTLMGSLGDTLGRSLRISNRKLRETSDWSPQFPSVRDAWPKIV